MVNESFHSSGLSYGESLFALLKDRYVEVYLGNSSKSREFSDYSVAVKEVLRGYLRGATGDLLLLEVMSAKGVTGTIYINCWCVTSVVEPVAGFKTNDVYFDEHTTMMKKI